MTSSGRQDGEQARDESAPIPRHQPEGQELWTRKPQSTSFTKEQEWSEQVPAAVRLSEAGEWHVQPLQTLQILDAPRPENSVPDRLWDWWNEDPPQRWQVDQWRWNERASSQTEGIGGRPGPPELMMKGGPCGHHGHIRFLLNRISTSSRARFLSWTEASQRRPGVITVAC